MKSSLKDFPRKISCPLRSTLMEGCSYAMKVTETLPLRPETILFVGAGATARLKMPTTDEQAGIIWNLCENDLAAQLVEQSAGCFQGKGQAIVDLLRVVDSGVEADAQPALAPDLCERVFPGLGDADVQRLVTGLRRHYDWSALKLIAKAKKGGECKTIGGEKPRINYLQEVFTLIDACLRESRGFSVYPVTNRNPVFLSVDRLRAARELLILLINTMFACAWQKLVSPDSSTISEFKAYRRFFDSLATLMQHEGIRFADAGIPLGDPEFYKLGYSLVTTNFEPIFLWLVWMGHLHVNKGHDVRIGNPGRRLNLLMNFPTTVGMRKPADSDEDKLDPHVWLPCTEAVAQNVNKEKYRGERAFRLGMYAPVHGMSTFRHCPVCGRLNLYVGDLWDENSTTLFPNGITAELMTGQKPRTVREVEARKRGEYDALACHFCGALTHAYDNFMFMQTQLKCPAPSFIKEMTDDALSQIAGAKHIVLLGYSLPLDDAIWGSLFTTMSRRPVDEKLYCSVVLYARDAPKKWLAGDELAEFISSRSLYMKDVEDIRGLNNALAVFGRDCVRAYMAGVPSVFGDGDEEDVRKLMFPTKNETGWAIPAFQSCGVVRQREDGV